MNWLNRNLKGDALIWIIVFFMGAASILIVYSSTTTLAFKRDGFNTEKWLLKQASSVFVGILCMYIVHRIDYRRVKQLLLPMLGLSVILLVLLKVAGKTVNSATRWLEIPVIHASFQPSDIAKLVLIISLAGLLQVRRHQLQDFKSLVPMLLWSGAICGLIALANISTAVLLFLISLLMLFFGNVPFKHLIRVCAIFILLGGVAIMLGERGATARSRIKNFFTEAVADKGKKRKLTESEAQKNFQREQSYLAITRGGVLGSGPGNGYQIGYLPESHADYVFASITEEFGLIGGAVIVICYLLLLWRGLVILEHSTDVFGGLLAVGLSFNIAIQAFFHMMVCVGLAPVTGQPLPFISHGGTAMITTGIMLGLIQSVSREAKKARSVAKAQRSNMNGEVAFA